MSTKPLLPLGLAVTALFACIAAFQLRAPELEAEYASAAVSYASTEAPLSVLKQQAAEVSDAYGQMSAGAASSVEQLTDIRNAVSALSEAAKKEQAADAEQRKAVDQLVDQSKQQNAETGDVLAAVLSNMLGDPIGQTFGERATIKVYSLKEAGYRGYLAKVKLHDPKAVELVLSGDKIGHKGETTSAAAKRTGAALAINAGGFSKGKDGLLYPLGVTVVDGEIVTFYQTGLSFIGFNRTGNLVGGDIHSRKDVEKLDVLNGATFVPTLLKDGKKQTIPSKWKNKKEPRTMIGHFSNGDLLFIVIDGRQEGYSSGVTLEEAQTKLLEWNVRDAYNLDGGGSSAFVYNGKVLNSPSDGKERKVVSNFVVFK
ncbi:phosphodiester glycosidase family protein [Paenibacillus sp.]|uniref:phosphodiester glycosidase family protein n=1 Tax=Paenibacillus sp. TaxID=58172 RepID=UPI002D6A12AE|nr:phosphodiester glycosidase family protein [Paenibacillus sp.]HZG87851.1 phosphodiester glycosidase family protein [Paenibacillus sp.]